MDRNIIKRFFNEKYIDDRDYGNLGGEYDPPEVLFIWTPEDGKEKCFRAELIDKEIGLEAYELAISPDDDRVHSLGWKDGDLTFLLSLISDKPGAIPSPEVLCAAFDQRWDGSRQRQSLKFLRREDYIDSGYNNKGYETVNNLGYAYYKTNRNETKFTVKDLKTFLQENNVPDDAVLKVRFLDCCEAFPCKLLHDRNKNEFSIVE